MPVDYVSDYEAVTGQKIPTDDAVEIKVITSGPVKVAESATVAETKKVKATR